MKMTTELLSAQKERINGLFSANLAVKSMSSLVDKYKEIHHQGSVITLNHTIGLELKRMML
jgi:hypothetical protein